MKPALTPYDPVNVLKPVDDNIWIVDGPIIRMSYLGGSVPFQTRMTAIRLASGDIFLWSPIAFDAALAACIGALGRVAHLVSPNKIHYAGIAGWNAAFPDAIVWASPGVRSRAASQGETITFDADLAEAPPAAWSDEIDQTIVRGGRFLEEVVFFHKPSRTLILADMIERFAPEKTAPRWRWLMKLSGATGPKAQIPFDLRLSWLGRKNRAQPALRQMFDWRPKRIIIAHGDWFESDGTAQLCRSFRWLGAQHYGACPDGEAKS